MAMRSIGSFGALFQLDTKKFSAGLKSSIVQVQKAKISITGFAKSAGASFKRLASSIFNLKTAFIGLVAGAGIGKAVKIWSAFQQASANVGTMLRGDVIPQLAKLKNQVLSLNPVLGSATELTDALYQALSGGVEQERAVWFVKEAAEAAKAGMADVTKTTEAAITVMKAYGKGTEETSSIFDQMFRTVQQGKLTMEGLSNAVGKVAGSFKQAGLSTEEMFAAISTLSPMLKNVDITALSLRAALKNLMKPSQEAMDIFNKFEIPFGAEAIEQQGLMNILMKLSKVVKENRGEFVNLFEDVNAFVAMANLSGEKAVKQYEKNLAELRDATGAVNDALKIQGNTFESLLKTTGNAAKNAIATLGEVIWETLSPDVPGMKSKLAELTIVFLNFAKDIVSIFKGVEWVWEKMKSGFSNLSAWGNKAASEAAQQLLKATEARHAAGEATDKQLAHALKVAQRADRAFAESLGNYADDLHSEQTNAFSELEKNLKKRIEGLKAARLDLARQDIAMAKLAEETKKRQAEEKAAKGPGLSAEEIAEQRRFTSMAEKRVELEKKLTIELAGLQEGRRAEAIAKMEAEFAKRVEIAKGDEDLMKRVAKWRTKSLEEINTVYAASGAKMKQHQATLLDFYKDLLKDEDITADRRSEIWEKYYKIREKQIQDHVEVLREAGLTEVEIAEWVAEKKKELMEEEKELVTELVTTHKDTMKTWAEDLDSTFRESFENGVFKILDEGFDSIGDSWKDMIKNMNDAWKKGMSKTFTDYLFGTSQEGGGIFGDILGTGKGGANEPGKGGSKGGGLLGGIMEGIGGWFKGGGLGGGGGGLGGGGLGGGGGGGGLPNIAMQSGGVTKGPTVALIGEDKNEAVVPLPDGKKIPVDIQGGTAPPVNITFNVQTPDVQSFTSSQAQLMAKANREINRARRDL